MAAFLPPYLLGLYRPCDPLPYLPPVGQLPYEKETAGYSGIGSFIKEFEDPKDTPPPTRIETRIEKQERRRREKEEEVAKKLEQDLASWAPHDNPNATTDPRKTIFVGRLNYDTLESKLRREFGRYGSINKTVIVHDKFSGRPRGYAFIEYKHEKGMRSACKYVNGKKIDGRKVVVDIERGRTDKGWLPRRLGGGLGGRHEKDSDTGNSENKETFLEDGNWERERVINPEHWRDRSRDRLRHSRSRDRYRERHMRDRSSDRPRGRASETIYSFVNDKGGRKRSRSTDPDPKRFHSCSRYWNDGREL